MDKIYLVSSGTGMTGLGVYAGCLSKYLGVKPIFTASSLPSTPLINFNAVFTKSPLWLSLPKDGVIHFSDQQLAFPLLYQKRKSVVTVHDIIPVVRTDDHLLRRLYYRLVFNGIRYASRVIADSEHTKKDILIHLGISEHLVSVVPLGVDHSVFFPSHAKREQETILYVGSEMPRKNMRGLLHAFALVKQQIPDAKLIKIGSSQWPGARAYNKSMAQRLGIADSIQWIDHAGDIASWYRKASVFVFPSFYEGFGLPVLEAMACGTPVVCSNCTSLPEITDNAALSCYPTPRNLADHMLAVLNDKIIARKLSRRGVAQAEKFSWQKCADMTRDVYERVMNES
ncbi:MAG: glycosyltransferase family 4 protein [Candidatus Aenigmarchaeota archaeon]|nr:glycosyltransferase family 4 protein [Candidatus Aenigmarchaeota archaeon]